MTLTKELIARGLVYQYSTEKLEEILDENKIKGYLGVDPSADSMHIGNLVAYILAQHLKNHGHEMVLLVGGATGLIGDPSFKEEERDIVDIAEIKSRSSAIENQIKNINGLDSMEVVNNYSWFKDINVLDFLREVGKHFNVGTMIKRESVQRRIQGDTGISFAEFSYSLIQGYDFFYLHKEKGCNLQIGGSDQWGNIISGVDLIRRKTGEKVFAMTLPLIVDAVSGKKFGKSEGNAVWLDPKKTSPYKFYQFWYNVSDDSVIDYLKKFTFISLVEIDQIEKEHKNAPHMRQAQKRLAYEVTAFVHGTDTASDVVQVSEILFNGNSLETLTENGLNLLLDEAPSYATSLEEPIINILVNSGLTKSLRIARELVSNGAVKINDTQVSDIDSTLSTFGVKSMALLKKGKKNICVLQV